MKNLNVKNMSEFDATINFNDKGRFIDFDKTLRDMGRLNPKIKLMH